MKKKKAQNKRKTKRKPGWAALYGLLVKPGDIAFQKGERVRGFLI